MFSLVYLFIVSWKVPINQLSQKTVNVAALANIANFQLLSPARW